MNQEIFISHNGKQATCINKKKANTEYYAFEKQPITSIECEKWAI